MRIGHGIAEIAGSVDEPAKSAKCFGYLIVAGR